MTCMTSQHQHDSCVPSPPRSPLLSPLDHNELPVIPTDDWGMVIEGEEAQDTGRAPRLKKKPSRHPKRQTIKYVSRHFSTEGVKTESSPGVEEEKLSRAAATPPQIPAKPTPRIYYGLNVDELSSDSSLSDVPDDIGPDPFLYPSLEYNPTKASGNRFKKKTNPTKSPFFPSPHRQRPTFLSTLPFPPLSAECFGLMQERLAHDPFRLLIATIFLNKTPGERAMPVFFQLMEKYPTPSDLAQAEVADVTAIIHRLGFQNQRARKCVAMSQAWVDRPPEKGKRYRKLNYPQKKDGLDVKDDEVLADDDERVAWEISHLPGVGAYSHDSWRMFCRDSLRGLANGWAGEDTKENDLEPEWKRVLPLDKELRAWMSWMWLKEGWVWNKETGKKTKASNELMEMASGGGIVLEEREKDTLTIQGMDLKVVKEEKLDADVARPAGEILAEADLGHEKLPKSLDVRADTSV